MLISGWGESCEATVLIQLHHIGGVVLETEGMGDWMGRGG